LTAIYTPPEDPTDPVQIQFYSYRSLLTFKLLKESPLGCQAGIKLFRLLMNSIGILAINHSDSTSDSKYCELQRGEMTEPDTLKINYSLAPEVEQSHQSRERRIRSIFRKLGCWPLGTIRPGHGSSIHYGGTLPMSTTNRPLTCDRNCQLHDTRNVFIADGSAFPHLPAKALTFTIMANANRVGQHVSQCLVERVERIAS
jgi:choline dehydrogenase-like flavoprotein